MDFKIKANVIRSKRKTISLEIKSDLTLLIRAPITMSDEKINEFVNSKIKWINKHINKVAQNNKREENAPKFTEEEIKTLTERAKEIIPKRAEYYSKIIGVKYNNIKIKRLVSRWGSCSGKKNLNFNCLIMLTPGEVIDYVVVHELCHIKEMNHSPKFWALVKKTLPNYEEARKWLRINGNSIISRLK